MQARVVHLGAGACSPEVGRRIQAYLSRLLASDLPRDPCDLMLSIEASGMANCGIGSSRTKEGAVENEACIADSKGSFFAVCAVPLPFSAVAVTKHARNIPVDQGYVRPLALVFSSSLVRDCQTDSMVLDVSPLSDPVHSRALDTAGIIHLLDANLSVCVSSSGGPKQKTPGRIGPSCIYNGNTYCTRRVSLCISGTGESLVRTGICRKLGEVLGAGDLDAVKNELTDFMEKEPEFPFLGGVGTVRTEKEKVLLVHFQTAASFVFGYRVGNRYRTFFHEQSPGRVFVQVFVLQP